MKQLFWSSIVIFILVLLVYLVSPIKTSFDSRWAIPTAMSIIEEGNADLSEYPQLLERNNYYCIDQINGRPYSQFPVWTYMLSVPPVLVFDRIVIPALSSIPGINRRMSDHITETYGPDADIETVYLSSDIEKVISSFYTALAVVFVYLAGTLFLRRGYAFSTALLFAFGTSAWSTASRALWMHGPTLMFLSLAVYLLLRAERGSPGYVKFISIPLAAAFMIRPTNAVFLAGFTIYIFLRHRKYLLSFLVWATPFAVLFCVYNLSVYHSLIPHYFSVSRLGGTVVFFTAFSGNLISPGRGLLVYSPFLIFCFHGFYSGIKNRVYRGITILFSAFILCHLIVVSLFPHWWGGHCFGSRFMSDILPFAFFLMFLSVDDLLKRKTLPGLSALVILSVLSIGIHFSGSWHWAAYLWNTTPSNVDDHPERLWDWEDPPFLR